MAAGTSILKLGPEPVDVKLRFDPRQATRKPSKFHEYDMLHAVNDGQMVYLDPDAHQQLVQSGAAAGDLVRLTRCRRGDEYSIDVKLVPDAPVATPEPAADPFATLQRPGAKQLAAALSTAVEVAIYIEEYARTKGRPLAFTTEDIRCMGIHLNIGSERGAH